MGKETEPTVYPETRYNGTLYGCQICKRELEPGQEKCPGCGARIQWQKEKAAQD